MAEKSACSENTMELLCATFATCFTRGIDDGGAWLSSSRPRASLCRVPLRPATRRRLKCRARSVCQFVVDQVRVDWRRQPRLWFESAPLGAGLPPPGCPAGLPPLFTAIVFDSAGSYSPSSSGEERGCTAPHCPPAGACVRGFPVYACRPN
jgi:hypothetical protein